MHTIVSQRNLPTPYANTKPGAPKLSDGGGRRRRTQYGFTTTCPGYTTLVDSGLPGFINCNSDDGNDPTYAESVWAGGIVSKCCAVGDADA